MVHERGRDASGEISDEDILVSDACEGGVVLEVRDVLNKRWRVGVVLPLGHVFSGEPGDGVVGGIMVFEHGFELLNEVGEGSNGDDSARDGVVAQVRADPLVM